MMHMNTETISLHFNSASSTLSLKTIDNEFVTVNYNADVDFTELIEKLSYKIDAQISISLDESTFDETSLNPKEYLILQTVRSFIESYNSSFTQEAEEVVISKPQN